MIFQLFLFVLVSSLLLILLRFLLRLYLPHKLVAQKTVGIGASQLSPCWGYSGSTKSFPNRNTILIIFRKISKAADESFFVHQHVFEQLQI
jgi:hypothetical protein